jgi:uncharacterized RDD family membrane protein YckC
MTRCHYCGVMNREEELRCTKCQRRLHFDNPRPRPESYPVIETAVAPELAPRPEAVPPSRPVLASVNTDAGVAHRRVPSQQALFAHGPSNKVVEFGDPADPRPERHHRSTPRRKPVPGQTAFEFQPLEPPARPLTRELDSKMAQVPVAPRVLRAMSATFDVALILAFSGLFLLTVQAMSRYVVGASLFTLATLPYLLAAPVLIGFAYKLLWCLSGHCTLGIQGARLRLVSFDGGTPTQTQRIVRFASGWLSLAACSLGLLWALGDQDTLTWHDHVSQTFLTAAE